MEWSTTRKTEQSEVIMDEILKKNTNIYLVYINLANSKTNLAQARLTYRVLCFSLSIKGKTLAMF